jgi:peptidoglycan hydrolase CwlO-like protein
MNPRFLACAAAILTIATIAAPVCAAPRSTAAAAPAIDPALLRQIADAQRGLGAQVQALKDKVDDLDGSLSGAKDERSGIRDDVKQLRDEVKGLYVEISGVKQQIDEAKARVDEVDSNVSSFRTFAGFFIALILLGIIINLGLGIRR